MLFVFLLALAFAGITEYEEYDVDVEAYMADDTSMYTTEDAPFGDDPSVFSVDFPLLMPSVVNVTGAHLFVYHSDLKEHLLFAFGGDLHFCCAPQMAEQGVCNASAALLPTVSCEAAAVRAGAAAAAANDCYYRAIDADAFAGGTAPGVREQFLMTRSGFWSFRLVMCVSEPAGATLRVTGQTAWRNPYGYLPASIMPFMPLYFSLCIIYFAFLVGWLYLMYVHRQTFLRLQAFIGALLFVSWLEAFIYSIDWGVYNYNTGTIAIGFNLVSELVYSARSVGSLMMLLLVAMGWQIYRQQLAPLWRNAVIAVGATDLALTFAYRFMDMLAYTPSTQHVTVPLGLYVFILLVVSMLDFAIIGWIALEYWRSLYILDKHQQTFKLAKFKRLALVLIGLIVAAVILFLIQAAAVIADAQYKWFRGWWLFSGLWHLFYFIAIASAAFLFRPSSQNAALAMVQLSEAAGSGGGGGGGDAGGVNDLPLSAISTSGAVAAAASAAAAQQAAAEAEDYSDEEEEEEEEEEDDGAEGGDAKKRSSAVDAGAHKGRRQRTSRKKVQK